MKPTPAGLRALGLAAGLLALFLALFASIQSAAEGLAGTDGYYHAKMGLLLRQQGLTPDFRWLPLTILDEEGYYDHHLLYHAYLGLFGGRDPAQDDGVSLTRSAKIASVVLPAAAFLALWALLRRLGTPAAGLWALGLFAVSDAFLYRMSMPRAQAASLLILALALLALFAGRAWLLAPLGFVYVWSYNAFPLLLLTGALYALAVWLTERRLAWGALAFPLLGLALGLVLNPYFPRDLAFVAYHLLPKLAGSETGVGNEWYPYESWTLVENAGVALAAFVAGLFAWGWRRERMDGRALTLFFLALAFLLMFLRARRFVEYFPAFALLFAAASLGRPLAA
ncbi:MAG: hypothetical protein ACRDHL_15245, partial [Candidatus Promineifilaceae bacterium]